MMARLSLFPCVSTYPKIIELFDYGIEIQYLILHDLASGHNAYVKIRPVFYDVRYILLLELFDKYLQYLNHRRQDNGNEGALALKPQSKSVVLEQKFQYHCLRI